jgi:hypothetical protein
MFSAGLRARGCRPWLVELDLSSDLNRYGDENSQREVIHLWWVLVAIGIADTLDKLLRSKSFEDSGTSSDLSPPPGTNIQQEEGCQSRLEMSFARSAAPVSVPSFSEVGKTSTPILAS